MVVKLESGIRKDTYESINIQLDKAIDTPTNKTKILCISKKGLSNIQSVQNKAKDLKNM